MFVIYRVIPQSHPQAVFAPPAFFAPLSAAESMCLRGPAAVRGVVARRGPILGTATPWADPRHRHAEGQA